MSDLFLNGDFEVEIGDRGDFKTVANDKRVEQSVAVHVTDAMYDGVGEVHNVRAYLRYSIKKALRTHDLLEETYNVNISKRGGEAVYEVEIYYKTSSFSFQVE